NNLSMMALILSIGFVVDDAIVMLENIVRHMEHGESPLQAALSGSKEIGFTIITMTTSLAAVFIPILFMSGILGRLFREFAVTITAAILISGVVSVTLTPMLCSRFLRVVPSKVGFAGLLGRSFELVPRKKRPLTAQQIAQQLRPQLLRFPGFRAFVNLPPALQIGGRMGNSTYQVTVQSLNTDVLYEWAGKLDQAIAELPELQDVSNDMEVKSPRVDLVIDRDKSAAVGLNAMQVENALYDGLGPKWSSTIYGTNAQYRVLIELDPKYQEHTDSLR